MIRKLQSIYYNIKFAQSSYSQRGEDIIVKNLFEYRKLDKPSYIDIGSHHPFFLNNTNLLYQRGSRGINIDPSEMAYKLFKLFRPDDINLNIAVSSEKGILPYYQMQLKTLNTLSLEEAQRYELEGIKIESVKEVKTNSIENIISDYNKGDFPDFMSLDVEGYELEILKTIDFNKGFPKVICVETLQFSRGKETKNEELIKFFLQKNYVIYADTHINTIFMHNTF